jgi:hypothetical protein
MGEGLLLKAWGPGWPFEMDGLGNPGRRIGCRNGAVETNDFDRRFQLAERACPKPARCSRNVGHRAEWHFNFEGIFAADSLQVQQRGGG